MVWSIGRKCLVGSLFVHLTVSGCPCCTWNVGPGHEPPYPHILVGRKIAVNFVKKFLHGDFGHARWDADHRGHRQGSTKLGNVRTASLSHLHGGTPVESWVSESRAAVRAAR